MKQATDLDVVEHVARDLAAASEISAQTFAEMWRAVDGMERHFRALQVQCFGFVACAGSSAYHWPDSLLSPTLAFYVSIACLGIATGFVSISIDAQKKLQKRFRDAVRISFESREVLGVLKGYTYVLDANERRTARGDDHGN